MTSLRPAYRKLEGLFDARIQALTTTHRFYRVAAHRFCQLHQVAG